MIRCTGRRMAYGNGHEHISHIQWLNDNTGEVRLSTRQEMVDFVKKSAECTVYTLDSRGGRTCVGWQSNGTTEWVQTYANGLWNDNLLALPLV